MNTKADTTTRPWRLAVLISGAGRTLQNLLDVIGRGELDAEIVVVISSKQDVAGIDIARRAGIPCEVIASRAFASRSAYSAANYAALGPYRPDLILMAGFLRQLEMPEEWTDRVLNIHPSLLPDTSAYAAGKGMYGIRVHRAVLAQGDTVSGATVHVVTAEYDSGPPLMTVEVPVLPGDDAEVLASRVFAVECELYPEAIRRYMQQHPELRRV